MARSLRVLALLAVVLAGCGGDPERARLDRTYDYVKVQIEAIAVKEIAALAYMNILDTGGSPLTYVLASIPEEADMVRIQWQGAPRTWSVRIDSGPGSNELKIEAYADSVAAPLRSEVLNATPMTIE